MDIQNAIETLEHYAAVLPMRDDGRILQTAADILARIAAAIDKAEDDYSYWQTDGKE